MLANDGNPANRSAISGKSERALPGLSRLLIDSSFRVELMTMKSEQLRGVGGKGLKSILTMGGLPVWRRVQSAWLAGGERSANADTGGWSPST